MSADEAAPHEGTTAAGTTESDIGVAGDMAERRVVIINKTTRDGFETLLKEEGLTDPRWVIALDDVDEPPLFSRVSQLAFLDKVPEEERCVAAMEIALQALEGIAGVAASEAPARRFFVCATVSDFVDWQHGEQPIPKVAILVGPDEEALPGDKSVRYLSPYTQEGRMVEEWLRTLGSTVAQRFVVRELQLGRHDPAIHRVYIGWRKDPSANVCSVGSGSEDEDPDHAY